MPCTISLTLAPRRRAPVAPPGTLTLNLAAVHESTDLFDDRTFDLDGIVLLRLAAIVAQMLVSDVDPADECAAAVDDCDLLMETRTLTPRLAAAVR